VPEGASSNTGAYRMVDPGQSHQRAERTGVDGFRWFRPSSRPGSAHGALSRVTPMGDEGGVAENPINFGFNASASLPERLLPWVRFEGHPAGVDTSRPSGSREMRPDLVDAAYDPTPRLVANLRVCEQGPPDRKTLAMVRRLQRLAHRVLLLRAEPSGRHVMVAQSGRIEQAVQEIVRVAVNGGGGGAMGCYPHGDKDLAEEDEASGGAVVGSRTPAPRARCPTDTSPRTIRPARMSAARAGGRPAFLASTTNHGKFHQTRACSTA